MALRIKIQSKKSPRVRTGSERDQLLSGVDFAWKSGAGSLNSGLILKPSTMPRNSSAAYPRSTASGLDAKSAS